MNRCHGFTSNIPVLVSTKATVVGGSFLAPSFFSLSETLGQVTFFAVSSFYAFLVSWYIMHRHGVFRVTLRQQKHFNSNFELDTESLARVPLTQW